MAELALLVGVIAGLIALNGLYVAAEFAIIGVRHTRIATLAEGGRPLAASIQRTIADPAQLNRYFATSQLGITAASLALGMYGEQRLAGIAERLLASPGRAAPSAAHGSAVVLAIAVLTFLHVVAGEMVPKSLALRRAEQTAFAVARFMALSQAVLHVPVWVLNRLGQLVLSALRIPPAAEHSRTLTAQELATVIGESAAGGLIAGRQHQILTRIFDFVDRQAHQIMTPRTRIVAIPVDVDPETLAADLAAARHTRFPVYEGDLDHIVGTLHLKDFIRWRLRPTEQFDVRKLARPARMVPEHMEARQLLETFREERGHMAIVIDEYGGTAGLVTLEDVAEELVGELPDEDEPEAKPISVVRQGLLEVRGDLLLVDLEDHVPLPHERPNVDTVGGLVVTLLGRPARAGDKVAIGQVEITVTRVTGLAVEAALVAFAAPAADPEATDQAQSATAEQEADEP